MSDQADSMEAELKDLVVEEAEVDAYMDEENAGKEKPTDEQWADYLLMRYEYIKQQYSGLIVAKREAELGKRTEWIAQTRENFSNNYKHRKLVVRELRKLGKKVEDPFIQG